ncbi:hypothetical protein M885DRAFT_616623 [Pelagophyceae sp. CCMP2097]|nr:hypothetical protein M885DRAFT_616623 [Pelagophyceae sp. CCMP2097]
MAQAWRHAQTWRWLFVRRMSASSRRKKKRYQKSMMATKREPLASLWLEVYNTRCTLPTLRGEGFGRNAGKPVAYLGLCQRGRDKFNAVWYKEYPERWAQDHPPKPADADPGAALADAAPADDAAAADEADEADDAAAADEDDEAAVARGARPTAACARE